jgi:hypothetical protein
MKQKGWPERAVYAALGRHYGEATGLAVPEPRSNLASAREAFYHLLAFGTLATWIFAIGYIWFELIDSWFPDLAQRRYYSWGLRQVSWQIAAILVAFPVFVLATRTILRDLAAAPEKAASPVRQWLTNIALLLTALVFVGDLISFLAVFLQGELTSRFVLKSLVVLALSGGVFAYYTPTLSLHRPFAITAGVLIALTVAFGFWKTGSPAAQRQISEDQRRVEDLYRIANAIHAHWNTNKELPKSLDALNAGSPNAALRLNDPFTNQPYQYNALDESKYRLCASFHLATAQPPDAVEITWTHPAGSYCFALAGNKSAPFPSAF